MIIRTVLVLFCTVCVTPSIAQSKYALIIGISGYPNFPASDQLKYAGRDAKDFAAFIHTRQGGSFPPDNVHLITNANASRQRLYQGFQWLYRTAGPDDLVYVFFAGHGVKYNNVLYFLPYEASKDQPDAFGIPMGEFRRRVTDDLAAKQVVVFIDACHAAGASEGARSPLSVDIDEQWESSNEKQGQFSMALFSSLAYQKSWEDPDLGGGHGLFTWYLLEGLKGAAPKTPQGRITAGGLLNYVRDKVEARSRERFPEAQTPFASPNFRTDFELAYAESTPTPSATVPVRPRPPISPGVAVPPAVQSFVDKQFGVRIVTLVDLPDDRIVVLLDPAESAKKALFNLLWFEKDGTLKISRQASGGSVYTGVRLEGDRLVCSTLQGHTETLNYLLGSRVAWDSAFLKYRFPFYQFHDLELPSGDLIFIFDPETKVRSAPSVLRVADDGTTRWRVDSPRFKSVALQGDKLVGITVEGAAVTLDPDTGKVSTGASFVSGFAGSAAPASAEVKLVASAQSWSERISSGPFAKSLQFPNGNFVKMLDPVESLGKAWLNLVWYDSSGRSFRAGKPGPDAVYTDIRLDGGKVVCTTSDGYNETFYQTGERWALVAIRTKFHEQFHEDMRFQSQPLPRGDLIIALYQADAEKKSRPSVLRVSDSGIILWSINSPRITEIVRIESDLYGFSKMVGKTVEGRTVTLDLDSQKIVADVP